MNVDPEYFSALRGTWYLVDYAPAQCSTKQRTEHTTVDAILDLLLHLPFEVAASETRMRLYHAIYGCCNVVTEPAELLIASRINGDSAQARLPLRFMTALGLQGSLACRERQVRILSFRLHSVPPIRFFSTSAVSPDDKCDLFAAIASSYNSPRT